jgi:ABC-type Mn2+/Zn2+ transport system ATPase subunit
MNNPVIQVKNLTVTFNKDIILNNISFSIEAKEIVAIIGPNGSGKTTLIKAILDLIEHRGEVKILGQEPKKSLINIGYVPQKFEFDRTFPLTIEEFMYLTINSSKTNKEKINLALKEVEMQNHKTKLLGQLSGGQLQRVLIAQAIINQPQILFLDEPTSGIDQGGEKSFYEIIDHLNSEHGVTIVMISHEINMVYKFATQIICLNKDLICMGAPKEMITKEVMKKLYGNETELQIHHH